MRDETFVLLAFLHAQGGRRARLAQALLTAGSARALLEGGPLPRPSEVSWQVAAQQRVLLEQHGIVCLPVHAFPPSLLRLRRLPPALFVRREVGLLSRPAIGIVGAREACHPAAAWAMERAMHLSERGWLIHSGGAVGVDSAAHLGALRAGAPTLVYLGVSADRVFPPENLRLFERILAAGGALVTEHAPGTATRGTAHADRNRFIAANARALLIAEAALQSGSLGTASEALRHGVPIFVSPPHVGGAREGIDGLLARGEAALWSHGVAMRLGAPRPIGRPPPSEQGRLSSGGAVVARDPERGDEVGDGRHAEAEGGEPDGGEP